LTVPGVAEDFAEQVTVGLLCLGIGVAPGNSLLKPHFGGDRSDPGGRPRAHRKPGVGSAESLDGDGTVVGDDISDALIGATSQLPRLREFFSSGQAIRETLARLDGLAQRVFGEVLPYATHASTAKKT
jgi:hypothetical protein